MTEAIPEHQQVRHHQVRTSAYRTAVEALENQRVVRKGMSSTSLNRRQKKKSTKKSLMKLKAEMFVLPADQKG